MFSKSWSRWMGRSIHFEPWNTRSASSPEKRARIDVVHVRELLVGRGVGGVTVKIDEQQIVEQIETVVHDLTESGTTLPAGRIDHSRKSGAHHRRPAEEVGADVIVAGTRGHGPVAGLLLGSVTQRLLHLAPCPVLAIPVSVGERTDAEAADASATNA